MDQLVEPLKDKRLIWVDACKNIYPKLGMEIAVREGWCVWRSGQTTVEMIGAVRSLKVAM